MSGITDTLLSSLDARSVQGISQQLGLSPQNAGSAIQAALPILLGQMSQNAAQPGGADALLGAVARDHTGLDIGGLLGGVLGALGGGQPTSGNTPPSDGMAILGHIFGSARSASSTQSNTPAVPTVPGLDSATSAKLLAMLAPLVMAALGRMMQGGQVDTGSVSNVLGGESQRISQAPSSALGGLMGAVLDRDGDGQVGVGDVLQAAQSLGSLFGKR